MNIFRFINNIKKILQAKPYIPESQKDNALLAMVLNRRSVRKFQEREIPEDTFHAILEAGRLAPSTVNLQTWYFIILDDKSWKDYFKSAIPFKAKRAIIILGDMRRTRRVIPEFPETPLIDYTMAVMNSSLAAMNMNLAAEALGVSSVMLSDTGKTGFFHPEFLKERLKLPKGVFPLITMVFGFAQKKYPPMPPRLPLEAISATKAEYKDTDPEILKDWYSQMESGYKMNNPFSTFQRKISYYLKNLERAEDELNEIIFQ